MHKFLGTALLLGTLLGAPLLAQDGRPAESASIQEAAAEAPKSFGVVVRGTGPTVVLIPGLGCGGEVWNGVVDSLEKNYECHILTLAGFAGQPPIETEHFLIRMRDDIATYLRAQKKVPAAIIGHSLGGFLVYDIAATHPDVVSRAIAVDGLPFFMGFNNPTMTEEMAKAQIGAMREQMAKLSDEAIRAQMRSFIGGDIADASGRETALQFVEESDPRTVAEAMAEMLERDLRDDLAQVKAPVLLLGAYSERTQSMGVSKEAVVKEYGRQLGELPTAQARFSPEFAGHFLMYDAKEWTVGEITAFLAED